MSQTAMLQNCDTIAQHLNVGENMRTHEDRLAHVGYLSELQESASSGNQLEVVATGADAGRVKLALDDGLSCEVSATAAGVRIQVADEKDVDLVIKGLRNAGAKLVSVQPIRQSLEELFMDEPVKPVSN